MLRPQYARLQIGVIEGQEETIRPLASDALSEVPYAEPSWLSKGYYSPYYTEGHRKFQKAVRKFFTEVIYPEAIKCEENGKRISQDVVDKLWCVPVFRYQDGSLNVQCSEMNIFAMRLGKGKHLKGLTLMGGIITPEEYDHFHEVFVDLPAALAMFSSLSSLSSTSKSDVWAPEGSLTVCLPAVSLACHLSSTTAPLRFRRKSYQKCFRARNTSVWLSQVSALLDGPQHWGLHAWGTSEAFAGSDVSGLQTTAVREGDEWVINGTKK